MAPPRAEYPRPQLQRERWESLNGPWRFAFDDDDRGAAAGWYAVDADSLADDGGLFSRQITVPFCYQSELSGMGERARHDVVWYARAFEPSALDTDERLLLHFGAVDYTATVWVNGLKVASHEGGHTPFTADVTAALRPAGNVVVVRAEDRLDDLEVPRGKQYWTERAPVGQQSIFYTPTTGIWQPVWVEPVHRRCVAALRITPELDSASVSLAVDVTGEARGGALRVVVRLGDVVLVDDRVGLQAMRVERRYSVLAPAEVVGPRVADAEGVATWSPESPTLYDLELEVEDATGATVDRVVSYFGMRKIETRAGRVYLNGRPYYQRLVLDQGYFPGGLLTAGSDDDLRRDIELAKQLGFNGARKHQKVEDPRWLYWADRLGFLVWGEMPSAYRCSPEMVGRLSAEWQAVVRRDYNHPCVVAWVPINESWGVPRLATDPSQRALLLALYHLTKALDSTRLVVSNDGWEHARTDLCTVHDYGDAASVRARYRTREDATAAEPQSRPLYTVGHGDGGEPILISEFGGIALADDPDTWGYRTVVDGDGLAKRFEELVAAIVASPAVQGFCYTQLTDVEQEANGLLTFDRKPKADPAVIRRATQQGNP